MNELGTQLHVVMADDLIQHFDRLGIRITCELVPSLDYQNTFVARVEISHALIPFRREDLGLLCEHQGNDCAVLAATTREELESRIRQALTPIASKICFVAKATPRSIYAGTLGLSQRV